MKDNFSGHASDYAKFRPLYPDALYEFILTHVTVRERAWDCATGNGQMAEMLSNNFTWVEASDISEQQLHQAPKVSNIRYSVQPAEKTGFTDQSFDLITVGQAVHWFDFDRFFKEVRRVLKPNGLLVLVGYGLLAVEGLTELIKMFYAEIIGTYWDPERKYIEANYQTIPFDFEEIQPPFLVMEYAWSKDQLMGYLNTWSAVKHYEKDRGNNPLEIIKVDLDKAWGQSTLRKVTFPLILKVGRNR
ncbi:class I SAM-dependent methyltransferase [Echinicola soli]|uniref:Class I SAM-dependent methyltransferase n=1 Tax=Echinicola soli TaxID=2591634 RepID=A0A514CM87_9BACT|nr:class I SAM-dependent methyltransferase [Echinicola soli]QDH80867.1 class I SAM-dependent methyltransferase [Echinicola soli]